MEYLLILLATVLGFAWATPFEGVPNASPCPDLSSACDVHTCNQKLSTYLYTDNGRTCPGCVACLPDWTVPESVKCPSYPCPLWHLPEKCTRPNLFSLYFDYEGRECRYCDIVVCDEAWLP